MSAKGNAELMLQIFAAIEQRDLQRVRELCTVDVEFSWPPSLPYGGVNGSDWAATWIPLQPSAAERRMDPRVVAATDEEVVVLWRQRGTSPRGDRCDSPVLALYRMREGKLARAQMFYFDPVAVDRFLANADPTAA